MAYYLGIDLGTTYTAAATERSGMVEAVSLGNRTASVPSVVFLRHDGEILVGEAATRRATSEPGRVAREFKRRVGDPTPIILGGTPYAAEMLMARVLRWSLDRVHEQQGTAQQATALTHPANWGPYKLDLLTQAVRQVDLKVDLLLPEPEAAATFYASQRRLDPGAVVAVYDLGGGTFDAAVVRRTAAGFESIGTPEGVERLGGIDFDEAVFAHVRSAIGGAFDLLDPEEPSAVAAMARVRQECIDAKEALSSDTDVSIPVLLPNVQTEVRLTRSEFEDMIRPAIRETIVALRRAIRSADVGDDDISAVLLVGGSSRIPLVGQMVGAELARPIAIDAHPKDAIGFGAAIAAAQRRGMATPESVTTVLPVDPRPPPPTVASTGRPRPAPPRPAPPVGGIAAGAAGAALGSAARPAPPGAGGGSAPPGATVPGRPAPPGAGGLAPPGAGGPGTRPAPPGAGASGRPPPPGAGGRPPPPGAGGGPAPPGAGASGGPAPPGAGGPSGTRPAPPGSGPSGTGTRPAPPTTSPGIASPAARTGPRSSDPAAGPGLGTPSPGGSSSPGGRPPGAAPGPATTRPGSPGPSQVGGAPVGSVRPGAPPPGGPSVGSTPTPGVRPVRPPAPGASPGAGTPTMPLGPPRHMAGASGGTPSGGYPAQPRPAGDDNRNLYMAMGIIAGIAVILIAVIFMATRGGGDGGGGDGDDETRTDESTPDGSAPRAYSSEVESEFVGACTAGSGGAGGTTAQCECIYDRISQEIEFDRFVEINDELGENPDQIPPELQPIVEECLGAT